MMWCIKFMRTPTGTIVMVDPKVGQGEIDEYGAEATTGILVTSAKYNTIERYDSPELQTAAEAADVIADRSERYQAWKNVEAMADKIARQMGRER